VDGLEDRQGSEEMNECEACGERLAKTRLHEFRDELLGLSGVILVDSVDEFRCTKCGERIVSIPDLAGLIKAVAVTRAKISRKLRGRDVRFLRKAMEWNAKTLAQNLGISEGTVSRWENDKEPMGPSSEKLLRLIVLIELGEETPGIEVDQSSVARMAIDPFERGKALELAFQLVPKRVNKKRHRVWGEVREAA